MSLLERPISPSIPRDVSRSTGRASARASALRPVFIVGCQRSGSTMLGAMLGAHPEIVCIPEAQFTVDLMPSGDPLAAIDPVDVIDRIAQHWRFRVWEFDLGRRRPARDSVEPTYRAAIEWLVREYAVSVGRPGARFWVDQDPGNVRDIWKLSQHFPDSKFVHIVRDGRAVAASMMPLDWGPNEIYTAAHWWQRHLSYGFVAAAALESGRLLLVRYEDVVEKTERTMRRLADFLGIEFSPDMLSTTGLKLPEFTRYQHQLIGAPPRLDRVESWRRTLSRREIEIFESVVGDLLPLLGYPSVFGAGARPLGSLERRRRILQNEAKKALHAIQMWVRTRPYRRSRKRRVRKALGNACGSEACIGSSQADRPQETPRARPLKAIHQYILASAAELLNGGRLLDFGCGRGEIVVAARERGIEAYGCDIFYGGANARAMLVGQLGTSIFEMIDGAIPFPDAHFECVVTNQVFEHIDDWSRSLAEINRVLKPGGAVLTLFPTREAWREGHIGIPFAHWFDPASKVRRSYTLFLRAVGFGRYKKDKAVSAWTDEMLAWIDQWTFYKRYDDVLARFNVYFAVESREVDYFLFRLRRSRLRFLSPILCRVQWLSRFACRHLSGAVLVLRKSGNGGTAGAR